MSEITGGKMKVRLYGFSIAKMQVFADVAVLSVIGIFMALVADMFLTPALIMFLKPYGRLESKEEINM